MVNLHLYLLHHHPTLLLNFLDLTPTPRLHVHLMHLPCALPVVFPMATRMTLTMTPMPQTSQPQFQFQRSEAWLDEYKEAAQDPQRTTLAAHELSDDHTWNLATDPSKHEKKLI